jgi:hypothetical protein
MTTPTHWVDKVNQIISTSSTRREFLKATTLAGLSVGALGHVNLLYSFAEVQEAPAKNVQQDEILDLMWGPNDPARVDRLIAILDQAIKDKNLGLTKAAAEGLAIYPGRDVASKLCEAFNAFPEQQTTQTEHITIIENLVLRKYIIQLMGFNFCYSDVAARKEIMTFFAKCLRDPSLAIPIRRAVYSSMIFIGNMSLRLLLRYVRNIRLADLKGFELVLEHWAGFMIKRIYPQFHVFERFADHDALLKEYMLRCYGRTVDYAILANGDPVHGAGKSSEQKEIDQNMFGDPDSKVSLWREQLKNKNPENIKLRTQALLNVDERIVMPSNPVDWRLLLAILQDDSEPPEVKIVVELIFGAAYQFNSPRPVEELLKNLKSSDKELVRAAAQAMRFKDGLPADRILEIIKQIQDDTFCQQLGDALFSSLDFPGAFQALVWSVLSTPSKDIADKKWRLDELRVWYVRLEGKRDAIVRQALSSEPEQTKVEFIEWLRNLSMIEIRTPMPIPTFVWQAATWDGQAVDSQRGPLILADMQAFERLALKLSQPFADGFRPTRTKPAIVGAAVPY